MVALNIEAPENPTVRADRLPDKSNRRSNLGSSQADTNESAFAGKEDEKNDNFVLSA